MSIKLYENDKEVYLMTLSKAAKILNTTTKTIRALAKKTYIPRYVYLGWYISSGDLDYIKEKLNGNLDVKYTGHCVELKNN